MAALSRRSLFGMGAAVGAMAMAPRLAFAQTPSPTFEAMLMNSFVNELLPKDAGEVFGKGAAGDIWRSMLSEQVSRQIAKSGALGLSRRLFDTHDLPGATAGAAARVGEAAQMSANILSAPDTANAAGGAILSTRATRS